MVAAVQHPPIQRRRSIDNSATTTAPKSSKMSSGFGALIRRASQRGGTVMNDASQQSSLDGSNNSGSGRIVRGFVKRAKSLRGSMDTSSNSRNGRSSSRDEADDQDDGPSGVASFLSQIEPPQESAAAAAAAVEATKQPEQAPEVEKPKQGGGLRGLLRRAASYRSERSIAAAENKKEQQQQQQQAQSHEAEQEELEPVLVLTDGNHGKVVFQNLDPDVAMSMSMNKLGGPTPSSSTYMDHNNASMPDLCGLSVSTSSRSTTSSSDSPVTVSKPLHTASTHTARTSATSRTSLASAADNDFYLDGSMEQQQQQPQPPQEKQQQKQPEPEPKGFTGRLRTLFKRTKSGRTVTEERPGEGAHVYVPSQDVAAASPLHEISLPVLDETDSDPTTAVVEEEHSEDPSEEHTEEQDIADSMHDSQHRVMESLLGVVQEYEMHEDQRSYCSTDDDEGYDDFDDGDYDDDDDYYGGDESGEDFGIYDEEPPAAADGQEALESFMASYCPQEPAYGDIQVEPQPARVYDELEIFYEEMTFEHVGGSMLLGAASELLTVPECDGEDFSESEEQFEDQEHEVAALCAGNLLPVMEEDMDESYSSGGSEFI